MCQLNLKGVEYDKIFDVWLVLFVMGVINICIVYCFNGFQGVCYGKEFIYDEVMMIGCGMKGWLVVYGIIGGFGVFFIVLVIKFICWVVEKFVFQLGEGLSFEVQKVGFFDFWFVGCIEDGKIIIIKVIGDWDLGYGLIGKMLGEVGMCLVFDLFVEKEGGFWMLLLLFNGNLMECLISKVGFMFEVLEIC